MTQWLVFTDLDGSLLDHDTYSYEEAESTLSKLEKDRTPVIFTTSKTRVEVISLRKEMQNQHPFIVENGAAVLIPNNYFSKMPKGCQEHEGYWVYSFSQTRKHWLELLDKIKADYAEHFDHFANMSIKEISAATGLSADQAQLANTREYSEPIQWQGNDALKQTFVEELESLGGTVLQGGRFLNLSGAHCKGKALLWLAEQYLNDSIPSDLKTLALGDSQNDISMLEKADYGCLIRSPSHSPPELRRKTNYLISDHFGPKGWAQGVNKIIYS
jgi:mannosyl-3-phosphoglycerate phosphatase family protein